jgi:uncharacterized Zn finger protein (UPF0148 family)
MNVRCYNCQFPFALSREEVYAALEQIHTEDLKHYNATCPRCGKVNKVSENQLKASAPEWEPGAKLPGETPEPKAEAKQLKKTEAKKATTTKAAAKSKASARKAPQKTAAKKITKRKGKARRK